MKQYLHRHTYAVIFTVLFIAGFSIIAMSVMNKDAMLIDSYTKGHFQFLQDQQSLKLFSYITMLGGAKGIVVVLVLSLLWLGIKRRYTSMIVLVLAVITTHFANDAIKNVFERQRPTINPLYDAIGYSFPSGHAMVSIVIYGFLAFLLMNETRNQARKVVIVTLTAILVGLIGFSRVVLSAHYPSDVLAGYCMGGMMLIMFMYIHQYFLSRQQQKRRRFVR
ncbi:phosphatase PAP2 family protein [Microbacteriaceae bacterium 4G12]